MIEILQGDFTTSQAEAWIVPVNCHGVVTSIISQVGARLPRRYLEAYQKDCDEGRIRLGHIRDTFLGNLQRFQGLPKWVLNFPYKNFNSDPPNLEWIRILMEPLVAFTKRWDVQSMAIPMLGQDVNDPLPWDDVEDLLLETFERVPTQVEIYKPQLTLPQTIKVIAENSTPIHQGKDVPPWVIIA